ncbi:nucleoside-diphosphate-sugar epimerase [Friedmanniella endophytica]|uniref:Nucleoside-diphosphate-sugar epimerase n=2 Tax=Microlunatus kandeliicorticis TaxID=1759536 RepID=A0A7W3P5Z7_9ACTN|nr:nucleoside-diphosphate-sugar epimerase [Microlunatus kandeliicorticis]
MKIMITGAAGWLGRYVAELLGDRHELVLLDQADPEQATVFDPEAPGGRSVSPLRTPWPYHRTALADEDGLRAALAGVDVVVHLAGKPTGDWETAEETIATNVVGTFNIHRAAVRAGVRRVVSASSINAFGTFFWRVSGLSPVRRALPLTEDEPAVPEDPYSLSKLTGELVAATFHRAFGLETLPLRFAGVWPEQRYDRLLTDGLPASTGWADDLWQWVHVRDVSAGIVAAAEAAVVTPEPIVLAAADTCAPEPTLDLVRRYRPDLAPHLTAPLPGRAPLLSIDRARTRLGYAPRFTLDAAPVATP